MGKHDTKLLFLDNYANMDDFLTKNKGKLVQNVRDDQYYLVRSGSMVNLLVPATTDLTYYVNIEDQCYYLSKQRVSRMTSLHRVVGPLGWHVALFLLRDGVWECDASVEDLGFDINEFRSREGKLPGYDKLVSSTS